MPRTLMPVVVGVGDVKNKSLDPKDAIEPMKLILDAIKRASMDSGLSDEAATGLLSAVDSISVVRTWTWPYPDLPGLLSERLGIQPEHRFYSAHGGHQPAKLFDEASRRISLGQSKVAIVTGGEALASLSACVATKNLPPPGWTQVGESVESVLSPTTRTIENNLGAVHHVGVPIQVYPLYENAFRAHRGQSIDANNNESARLYAGFAKVAEHNQYAWNADKAAETEETIANVTTRNRMICFPYPLLMNAFNTVNLAAACLLTSTEYAQELGIPEDKWIYPLGGAGTRESDDFWNRPNFFSSPSIFRSLDAALELSGLEKDDLDVLDLYSCFPIIPKLACHHLGLSTSNSPKPITLLGGLTSFGGAGNNYAMHALTATVRHLRSGSAHTGLILANGGVATYQHVVCLSSHPRRDGLRYPDHNPLSETVDDIPVPTLVIKAEGKAIIETYTVDFQRNGNPLRGHIVGRLKSNGHRFIANDGDTDTLHQLSSRSVEPIGRSGFVRPARKGNNLFSFDVRGRL